MKLDGRVALVTGASRGVGKAIALELARRGADLILAARTLAEPKAGVSGTLTETAAEVEALGRLAHIVAADLNDPIGVERLAEDALAWRGRVDVLVSNAAFQGKAAYHGLDELELKNFQRQFNVNVTASFILSKALVPQMRANGGGVIVNITSGAGFFGQYAVPGITYASTKAALNRMSMLLARDLERDGIAVFAVNPGYTFTELVEQTADQAGMDVTTAHAPEVPARVVADLIEADLPVSSGRVWSTIAGKGPVLIYDRHQPMPTGDEVAVATPPTRA